MHLVEAGSATKDFVRGAMDEALVLLDSLPPGPEPSGTLAAVDASGIARSRVLTDAAGPTFTGRPRR